MIQIESFDDLDMPIGLFPSEVAFFLEAITSRTVNNLAGLSLDEVNEALIFVRHLMRQMNKMGNEPAITEWLGPIIKRIFSTTDRFVPPKESKSSDKSMIQFLDKSFFNDENNYLKQDIKNNKHLDGALGANKKAHGATSLYYYMVGKKVAERIQRSNHDNNSSYYRLGKATPFFMTCEHILNLIGHMDSEVSAVKLKENQLEEKRKETARKGGKQKNDKFSQLKSKCLSIYNDKYTDKPNRDAAAHIYRQLSDDDKSVFRGDDPKHQIAIWIGKYKKGELKID